METGVDNANNPFAISNGSPPIDNSMSCQKDNGLLLNLTDNFKQNGDDISPIADFCENSKKSVKKRLASSFFDDLSDEGPDARDGPDMDEGPETDVDALSPLEKSPDKPFSELFGNNNPTERDEGVLNPFVEHQEKAALDMERSLQKLQQQHLEMEQHYEMEQNLEVEQHLEGHQQQPDSSDDQGHRLAREETPTPPADTVHDVGGLVENVAESESEDEWNYIKGEEANKENKDPQPSKQEVADTPEEEDNMSQLNPNAAEFVPVSPTRSIPSPACRMLINDEVISQSPKRPINVDINVPNIADFETEIKSRPSEVDSYSNGHNSDDDHSVSTPDKMESLLNGKNIDEIPEFQPGSTPQKSKPNEEFHFGPNAAPFTPIKPLDQSEAALSTRAVYGDESTATLGASFNESAFQDPTVDLMNKESDPMSMSFYADKGDSNPFDLNEVHVLPKNLDEFLSQPDNEPINQTVSDLPEHSPLTENITLNNDDALQTTNTQKHTYDDEKELASPLEPEVELFESTKDEGKEECDRVELEPNNEILLHEGFCQMSQKSPIVETIPRDVELISPEPPLDSSEPKLPTHENIEQPTMECELLEFECTPAESSKGTVPGIDTKLQSPDDLVPELEPFVLVQKEDIPEVESELPKVNVDEFQLELEHNVKTEENFSFDNSSKRPENSDDLLVESIEEAGRDEVKSPFSDSEKCNLLVSTSPVCDLPETNSPICDISEKSSVCNIAKSNSPILDHAPCAEQKDDILDFIEESCDYTKADLIEEANKHFDELCQPHEKSDLVVDSTKGEISSSERDEVSSSARTLEVIEDSFVENHFEAVESCPFKDPEPTVTQSVEQQELLNITNPSADLNVDPLPLHTEQIIVETENISPEFPEQAIVTPSEESNYDDVPPAPLKEEPVEEHVPTTLKKEPVEEPLTEVNDEINVAAVATAAVATTALAAAAVTASELEPAQASVLEPAADSTPTSIPETVPTILQEPAIANIPEPVSSSVPETSPSNVSELVATNVPSLASALEPAEPIVEPVTPPIKPDDKKKVTSVKKLSASKPATAATKTTPRTSLTAKAPATRLNASPKLAAPKPGSKPAVSGAAPKLPAASKIGAVKTKTATSPKPADKKSLTNGDVKAPSKSTIPAKKPASETTVTKTATRPATAAPKSNLTAKTTNPRPATTAKTTTTRPLTTTAPKPRPATLSSRPASAKPLMSTTTKTALTKTSPKAATAPAAPRPKPATTAAPKPRVPLTKPLGKAPDTEKQNKESANKITASKSSSTKTIGMSSVRKVESKTMAARTTVSKTTTTTMKSTTAKKPAEIIRNPSKTKTTKIEKPKQNGVSTVVTEEITIVNTTNSVINDEPQLVKDNSPIDNKLLIEENTLIETNAAD